MNLLQEYAKLIIRQGVNVQKGQPVIVNAPIECATLARLLTAEAYAAGASKVIVDYVDNQLQKIHYLNQDLATVAEVEQELVDRKIRLAQDENAANISISSTFSNVFDGVDPEKIKARNLAMGKALMPFRKLFMANHNQWCVCAGVNEDWVTKLFGDDASKLELLQKAIFNASYVFENGDAIEAFRQHNLELNHRCEVLNKHNFSSLVFTNALGTNLEMGIVPNHIWCGGSEISTKGVEFNANIPTEEVFTMPDKYRVNGRVYASKALEYAGVLIDGFWLEFKDGKVVDFDAKQGKEVLASLISMDEGSCYTGEMALVNHSSPISQMNILFYNTLFDENAACHIALGNAYPINVKGGASMTSEELEKAGSNLSNAHVDFMFGTHDLKVVGKTYDNQEVVVMENGEFIL